MTVYVDDMYIEKGNREWCHLMADSLDELHEFAGRIGLKREDCHNGDHYDVTRGKRLWAIQAGAVAVKPEVLVEIRRRLRREAKGQKYVT